MDTATALIKSGATPDVLRFVNETRNTIVNGTQLAIESEHSAAQKAIDDSIAGLQSIVANYTNAIDTSTDDESRDNATHAHHLCRSEEAAECASSRKCHIELEELWKIVVVEEKKLHDCHEKISLQWCVAPPMLEPDLSCPEGMGCPWDWANQMSVDSYTYPSIAFTQPLIASRSLAITNFECYITQRPIVVKAWKEWEAKVILCQGIDANWDAKAEKCDKLQDDQDSAWCTQAVKERNAGAEFGVEWAEALATHNELVRSTKAQELDRNMEWTSLHIVTCLLDVIYVSVTRSIDDDVPCITEESDPEKVRLDIDTCHQVTENLTNSCPKADFACDDGKCTCLTIIYPPPPALPPLPPVIEYPCTPAYVALHHFLLPEPFRSNYVDTGYQTGLQYGWPGCAAPRVCKPCLGMEDPVPDDTDETGSHICHHHENYLMPGQMDLDSFRCLSPDDEDRPQCVKATLRCNTHSNCVDGSDEIGCESDWGPPVLTPPVDCPSDTLSFQHLMQCGGGKCISAAGECNEFSNCENGKDELSCGCTGSPVVEVTATSGRVATTISGCGSDTEVFSDRDYLFTDMGGFDSSFTFIKIANDDKDTSEDHVMLRVTIHEPVTFFCGVFGIILSFVWYLAIFVRWFVAKGRVHSPRRSHLQR